MNELYLHVPGERVESPADLESCGHGAYCDDVLGDDAALQFFPRRDRTEGRDGNDGRVARRWRSAARSSADG